MEGTNKWVKDNGTLRDQVPLSEFLDIRENKLIVPWSKSRNIDDFNTTKEFHLYSPIPSALWTKAYVYHQEKRRIIKPNFEGIEYQCVGCSNVIVNSTLVKEIISKQQNLSFENFNDFIDTMQSVRWVKLNNETYQLGKCTCSNWHKNFICKHVISMSKTAALFQSFPAVDIAIELFSILIDF